MSIIVQEAKLWLGTPFREKACVRNGGADCATFIKGVLGNVGLLPVSFVMPSVYSLQTGLHKADERYVNELLKFCDEVREGEVSPGDIVVFKTGRSFWHGAIVTAWPMVIHATEYSGVCYGDVLRDPFFKRKMRRFFRVRKLV